MTTIMATMVIIITTIITKHIPKMGEIVLTITIMTTTKNIKDEKYKRKARGQNGKFCLTLACPDNNCCYNKNNNDNNNKYNNLENDNKRLILKRRLDPWLPGRIPGGGKVGHSLASQ